MATEVHSTTCAIAGGGPAGIVLGYILARAGIEVIVLEKHKDFLRDFRGDTIHPSTLEVMHQLGIADRLLQQPYDKAEEIAAAFGDQLFTVADFRSLPVHHPFIALMPQWDFLNFLAGEGRKMPNFKLLMQAEVTEPTITDGVVTGVVARTPEGEIRVEAHLVVAADGRHSTLRTSSGLPVEDIGAPMDVLWFRLSRIDGDPVRTIGRIARGGMFVMIQRGDYYQCGLIIPKGGFDMVKAEGIEAFHAKILRFAPFLGERTREIASFDDVRLLTVGVDRMTRWYKPGLLFIGDAAHTMSPVGGVGINLAIQDAVAAANLLALPLKERIVTENDLEAVQDRREWPIKMTQKGQVFIQNNVVKGVLDSKVNPPPPTLVKLLKAFPWLRRIPARLIGMGVRPEYVDPAILEKSSEVRL